MFLDPSNLSHVPARLGTPHKVIQIQMAVGFLFRFNHYLYAVWHYPHLVVVPTVMFCIHTKGIPLFSLSPIHNHYLATQGPLVITCEISPSYRI
jgi:hypothetical protein